MYTDAFVQAFAADLRQAGKALEAEGYPVEGYKAYLQADITADAIDLNTTDQQYTGTDPTPVAHDLQEEITQQVASAVYQQFCGEIFMEPTDTEEHPSLEILYQPDDQLDWYFDVRLFPYASELPDDAYVMQDDVEQVLQAAGFPTAPTQ